MKRYVLLTLTLLLLFSGCTGKGPQIMDGDGMMNSYISITQAQAQEMMQKNDGYVIVDVRRPDEFAQGHIPGAVCIPNETIGEESPEALPDHGQVILVYCRSGRRSKEAAQKLFDLGYSRVYEFGGIIDWDGETVTDDAATEESESASDSSDVSDAHLVLLIDGRDVPVTWEENAAVSALREMAATDTVRIETSAYGGFEQVGPLGNALPRDDGQITTVPGDIVLYAGEQIVVFFGSNDWAYTRLGHIGLPQEELTVLLDKESVTLELRPGNVAS